MTTPLLARPFFFVGIGGSGMLPLAAIVHGLGARVAGSDRSFDQGRTPEKFAWMARKGFTLFTQDGSGVTSPDQVLVASAAIESTVPEVARAEALGCARMSRAQLLAELFNASPMSLGVAGTSGKSTTTGMLGWIMAEAGRAPTIMNGAVMKNFASADEPFASAVVGSGDCFVSEVDESDGSIALYRPTVALLLNVSLDHKSMEELRVLFGNFVGVAASTAYNADDPEAVALAKNGKDTVSFGIDNPGADLRAMPDSIVETTTGISADIWGHGYGSDVPPLKLELAMPGRHNLMNAMAAIAAAYLTSLDPGFSVQALHGFKGLARRFDIVGTTASGITVIDDFGHNPEKCRATLRTLKSHPGRVLAFFQPHGYGPLRQMGAELAQTFAEELGPEDHTIMCDPVYFGGTVDRSEGSERIVNLIIDEGSSAEYIASRDDCAIRLRKLARPGDRIVIMGARDDTLSEFARTVLASLQ